MFSVFRSCHCQPTRTLSCGLEKKKPKLTQEGGKRIDNTGQEGKNGDENGPDEIKDGSEKGLVSVKETVQDAVETLEDGFLHI